MPIKAKRWNNTSEPSKKPPNGVVKESNHFILHCHPSIHLCIMKTKIPQIYHMIYMMIRKNKFTVSTITTDYSTKLYITIESIPLPLPNNNESHFKRKLTINLATTPNKGCLHIKTNLNLSYSASSQKLITV